ncbi:IDEAL domain-containing protein [Sporosarcina contaminans]|uniref:IDEAL domain-containing protein n=1 Tax=Sporosarcina contaminans TaxID=633403 RepID=A0ABW3U138_9BACL
MEKNYSYAEFLKAVGKNSSSLHAEKLLNEIYMDLFISHIHREQNRNRLLELIDESLDHNDKEAFHRLTEELRLLDEN